MKSLKRKTVPTGKTNAQSQFESRNGRKVEDASKKIKRRRSETYTDNGLNDKTENEEEPDTGHILPLDLETTAASYLTAIKRKKAEFDGLEGRTSLATAVMMQLKNTNHSPPIGQNKAVAGENDTETKRKKQRPDQPTQPRTGVTSAHEEGEEVTPSDQVAMNATCRNGISTTTQEELNHLLAFDQLRSSKPVLHPHPRTSSGGFGHALSFSFSSPSSASVPAGPQIEVCLQYNATN